MTTSVPCRGLIEGLKSNGISISYFTRQVKAHSKAFGKTNICIGVKAPCQWRPGFEVKSVLDKSSGKAGSNPLGSSGSTDPARAALERLFEQAQWHEERLSDPNYAKETGLELAVSELEVDLTAALNALRVKEEKLREAEQALLADQREVQMARAALLHREKELEAVSSSHSGKQDELRQVHQALILRGDELLQAKQAVKGREAELLTAQKLLQEKQEDLNRYRFSVLEMEDALADAASNFKLKQLELEQAQDLLSKQVADKEALRTALLDKESELQNLQKDKQWKQEKLEKMEIELEERKSVWLNAQEVLQSSEQDLTSWKLRGKVRDAELSQLKVLLTEVQAELDISQNAVASFRQAVAEQGELLQSQQQELSSHKVMLASYVKSLESAKFELEKEQERSELASLDYKNLQEDLRHGRQEVKALESALTKGKALLQESMAEVNALRREVQEKDSALSDTELILQLKETELVGTKLELQEVRSDLSSVKLTLSQKDIELQAAEKSVEALQKEVTHVRGLLQTKEVQLAKVTLLLRKKEEEVASLQLDLDDSNTQLNQVTSVVQQITELSRALVDSTTRQDVFEEQSVLMQKNLELFATKRALFETEMQVERLQEQYVGDGACQLEMKAELKFVKESLLGKDLQLIEAQEALATKDQELKLLLNCWDAREAELSELQAEVIDEAEALSRLRTTQLQGGNTADQLIEGEKAKMVAEAAMAALRNLVDLSSKYCADYQSETVSEPDSFSALQKVKELTSMKYEKFGGLEELKARLLERDTALDLTKGAMENLSNLTKRLLTEAGLDSVRPQAPASA